MRRTKEDAEQTRRAILASALDIFFEKGYSKTTFDEIAKRINLTKGAVYWYFRNKPDIVAALINEYANDHIKKVKQLFMKSRSICFDDIINMMLFNNRCICEDKKLYKFIFFVICQMEWSESIISKIQPLIKQTKDFGKSIIRDSLVQLQKDKKIRSEVDINVITEILNTMYAGMMESYLARRMEGNFDEIVKTGFNLIFNNIKTEGIKDEN